MQELINISGQQFYYSSIEQVIESCSQKENCAIIIDEGYLDQFFENGNDLIGSNINKIIIIGESVNTLLSQLEGVSVLLLAAAGLKDALKIALLGEALSKVVFCVSKEGANAVAQTLSEIAN